MLTSRVLRRGTDRRSLGIGNALGKCSRRTDRYLLITDPRHSSSSAFEFLGIRVPRHSSSSAFEFLGGLRQKFVKFAAGKRFEQVLTEAGLAAFCAVRVHSEAAHGDCENGLAPLNKILHQVPTASVRKPDVAEQNVNTARTESSLRAGEAYRRNNAVARLFQIHLKGLERVGVILDH
jgi:hypothetical protein